MERYDIVVLPEYLPSRFGSWLEFYFNIEKALQGREYNDDTVVDWGEIDRDFIGAQFIQKFRVGDVKIKAFEYVISMLPNQDEARNLMYQYRSSVMFAPEIQKTMDLFNNLISISKPTSR